MGNENLNSEYKVLPINKDGSHDLRASDHDQPYILGRRPRAAAPFPFSTHQYARLLILRSRFEDGLITGDTTSAEESEVPEKIT